MDTYLLTINEVAEKVRVTPRTVRRWIDEGKLQFSRVGVGVRIAQDDVEKFIKPGVAGNKAAGKARPDMNELTNRIEQMLAANPRKTKPDETARLIEEVRKGREDAILHRH